MRSMMAYFGNQVEQMLMRKVATDPDPNRRWARAMLSAALPLENPHAAAGAAADNNSPFPEGEIEQFMLATLAGAVNNPELLSPLREFGRQLQQRLLADSADGIEQLLIWLMVDGLFLWQFVGLIHKDDPLYSQIGEALRAKVASGPVTPPVNSSPGEGA